MESKRSCPLCSHVDGEESPKYLFTQKVFQRDFYQCSNCDLHFVDEKSILSKDEEKSRYEDHRNEIRTKGYESFLRRLISPLSEYVDKDSCGLDYGSGPYPMLLEILSEDGYTNLSAFDPIFKFDTEVFDNKYDFITCCEVIEHMTNPVDELKRISLILRPGGVFIVSTGILWEDIKVEDWHYIKDNTHIRFFTPKSLEWISSQFDFELISASDDLVIFLKK